jgi:hypothetical protein
MVLWSSWSARRPVKAEVAGSSPVRTASISAGHRLVARSWHNGPVPARGTYGAGFLTGGRSPVAKGATGQGPEPDTRCCTGHCWQSRPRACDRGPHARAAVAASVPPLLPGAPRGAAAGRGHDPPMLKAGVGGGYSPHPPVGRKLGIAASRIRSIHGSAGHKGALSLASVCTHAAVHVRRSVSYVGAEHRWSGPCHSDRHAKKAPRA